MTEHGIHKTPVRFIILAGTFSEYNRWRVANNIPRGEALYVSTPEILRGQKFVKSQTEVIELNQFKERADREEIRGLLKTRFF